MGVMLYEMLRGQVPFEGSTMAEVLMKHLTTQPVLDEMPEPFGKVVQKALEKDPNDRYQTVEEMAEDILGVEEVSRSLVGFDAVSLTDAVRRTIPTITTPPRQADRSSPIPSLQPSIPVNSGAATVEPGAPGIGRAFRDFAQTASAALKSAASGIPVGTPPGQAPALSPETAAGQIVYAGFWIRALAFVIDATIVGLLGSLIGLRNNGDGVLLVLYHALMIATWNGQTIGKRACGVRVIALDGRYPTVRQAFGRSLATILSVFPLMIGFLMAPFDHQKRTLHDRLASTFVVRAIT